MTKSEFKKHIIVSSLLTVVAIAVIISFCVIMFDKYSKPSEDNTSVSSGTVAEVYYARGNRVIVEMSDGEQFQLVCPWLPKDLYNAIGYDLDQLAELLEGQKVEYRKMDKLPWVVEIYINDIVIDNNRMTSEEIDTAYVGIVIIGLIMLAFPVCGEVEYIKAKHKIYKKAEKKRVRSAKRKESKSQNS